MSLHVSTTSMLTDMDKLELTAFLTKVLTHPTHELEYGTQLLCQNKLGLYYNNRMHVVNTRYGNTWNVGWNVGTSDYCYLGVEGDVEIADKLAVLFALMQYVTPTEALTKAASDALGRYLLSERNVLGAGLTVSEPPATGIAFSDTQVASLVGGVWMLPSGEEVDVSGEGWVVSMGRQAEVAVSETATVPAVPAFTVGQRVHWDGVPGVGPLSQDGVISGLPTGGRPSYSVTADNGDQWGMGAAFLTPIPPPTFAVGQRVRYSRIEHITEEPGEGVVRNGPYDSPTRYDVTTDDLGGGTYYIYATDLTPITEDADISF